jgi:hypothetical protein
LRHTAAKATPDRSQNGHREVVGQIVRILVIAEHHANELLTHIHLARVVLLRALAQLNVRLFEDAVEVLGQLGNFIRGHVGLLQRIRDACASDAIPVKV